MALPGTLAAAWVTTPGVGDLADRVDRSSIAPGRPVGFDAITPLTVEALIATEDERFWSNSGIDLIGLMRAIPYDIVHASFAQGGSTLTEQLAKNLWLGGRDQRIWSKIDDMALALKLNQRYSKRTILAAYLDTAYFGEGSYGISNATRRYFGVAPGQLDATQATVLVGLVQAPTSYDPYTHPLRARQRQVDVLRSLVRVGAMPETRARRLLAAPLRLADGRVVPGITGVALSPGPAVSWPLVLLALAAAAAGIGAFAVARRGRRGASAPRLAALAATCLVGCSLVLAVRAIRVL